MRYGMVIDLKRCIGCNACTIACKQEHGTPSGIFRSRVMVSETGSYPNARLTSLPLLCNQCEDAACVRVCPVGATTKRPDGIVSVDQDKCLGCRYCMVACPYNARQFIASTRNGYYGGKGLTAHEKAVYARRQAGVVEKCDFCAERLERGQDPACVHTCPATARFFGDLDDPGSRVAKLVADSSARVLKPERGTRPSVFYIG